MKDRPLTATIFNIERHALHDGPGIRTLVFFKGCPLSCLWCSNPEGQSSEPVLIYHRKECIQCGRCLDACPRSAISPIDDGVVTDRTKCDGCGECVKTCPTHARCISGKQMTIEEVMDIIVKDEIFYRWSGGGITASGGEALAQGEFLSGLFSRCKAMGIGTALETSGFASWAEIEKIAPQTDVFLYDVKHIDAEKHYRFTGQANHKILENLNRLSRLETNIVVRVPIVPGFNDSEKDLKCIVDYIQNLKTIHQIDFLPYHCLGEAKCQSLETAYPFNINTPLNISTLKHTLQKLNLNGFKVKIEI
jgi:pyruvate formate lyase activating enzyme